VRLALGAQRHDIIEMIVGNGMKLALVGLALGVAGAIAISGILQQFVYGMSATDPATLAGVTALCCCSSRWRQMWCRACVRWRSIQLRFCEASEKASDYPASAARLVKSRGDLSKF